MGLFEKIFGPRAKDPQGQQWVTLNNFDTASWSRWSGDAFESDLVRASVDARARHIGKLSVVLSGSAQTSLQNNLMKRPNSWTGWYQFLYRLSVVLDMQCTAFIVPVYNDTYDVIGISMAVPADFELVDVMGTPWLRMRFSNGQTAADELKNIGIMTKYQYLSDYFGTGNTALQPTLELIDIQRQVIQESAKDTSSYRFMATLSNFTKPEDLEKERERFTEKNLKSGRGLLLFPNTYKDIKELDRRQYTVDADQQHAIESRVFNYFGVNEKILSNSATADDLDAFYEGAIEPFAVQLADVLTGMLFSSREQAAGNRVQFSSDRLAYMSTQNKIALIQQMSDRGELTQNEARRILNLPDLPTGNSTIIRGEYYVQSYDDDGNVIPMDGEDDEDYVDDGEDIDAVPDDDADNSDDMGEEEGVEGDTGVSDSPDDSEDFVDDDDLDDLNDQMKEELDALLDQMREMLSRADDGEYDDEEEPDDDSGAA